MPYPLPTSGSGIPARIKIAGTENAGDTTPGYNDIVLSMSGSDGNPETFQLSPIIVDALGVPLALGTQFTLSAVAASSGGTAVYTGTITGGASNAFEGETFVVAGFTATNNNGTFICTASSATTLTLENGAATAVTAAGTATAQESTQFLSYYTDGSSSYTQGTYNFGTSPTVGEVVSVSSTGLLTTNGVEGTSEVTVAFAAASNTGGNTSINGVVVPTNKIQASVSVTVVP